MAAVRQTVFITLGSIFSYPSHRGCPLWFTGRGIPSPRSIVNFRISPDFHCKKFPALAGGGGGGGGVNWPECTIPMRGVRKKIEPWNQCIELTLRSDMDPNMSERLLRP
jgi:hypothetical protein